MHEYEDIPGAAVEDTVVPARGSWSRRIDKGQVLRIVDLEGRQAVDFLCYNAHDTEDRYAAADTMKKVASTPGRVAAGAAKSMTPKTPGETPAKKATKRRASPKRRRAAPAAT